MEQMKTQTSKSLKGNQRKIGESGYRSLIEIVEKSDMVKRATFLDIAGDAAIKVFNKFNFQEDCDYGVLEEMFK